MFRMTSRPTMHLLVIVIGLAVQLTPRARSMNNDILGLAIPREMRFDVTSVCRTYPDLTSRQYALCSRYPDVAASAIQGVQVAVHECQYQMRAHRWNCSTLETKNKNPHSSRLLSRGFKESAFAYAISAAGMTTQVARACSLGKLTSCGCSRTAGATAGEWKWQGCDHNTHFADQYAKRFLRLRETARDLHSQANLHNNRAGRLAVSRNLRLVCKCHGMSGGCEMKTCWKSVPAFRAVGGVLKAKYDRAAKVDNSNSARGRLRLASSRRSTKKNRNTARNRKRRPRRKRRRRRKPFSTDLVYFRRSPTFCERDARLGSPGTVGRYCNTTSGGLDNCETLCCGRGYDTLRLTRSERCHCRFHWCCYVVCQTCASTRWVTVCK